MDDAARLRRKDTTKGAPLRILSLDGGGIRGYSMLIILQELMHRTFVEIHGRAPKREEIPKPCDHFDLIAGTGTGGLIAIMLGRLRLDLETCKDVYVRMTRKVFETDKTIIGLPVRSTMYKASKLEEAIRDVVKNHTVLDTEGNDTLANATPMSPQAASGSFSPLPQRTLSQTSRYSQIGVSPTTANRISQFGSVAFGNPDTLLYDTRENRTKTAVTAVLRGTPVMTFLRSYDSRKEPAPDVNCSIWQAGRATSAIYLAFKPIQIGQSVYLDEGVGRYNPSPLVLDEAAINEWPGREIGVFVSVGTGKRPPGTNNNRADWWEGFLGGNLGSFADARRRLIAKLEACEETHEYMLREHLSARGVNVENYYRLNVEVGVGEFGMNEWARMAEVSTSTRSYLAKRDIERINQDAAAKMAKIYFARQRQDRTGLRGDSAVGTSNLRNSWEAASDTGTPSFVPSSNPLAVELPGDDRFLQTQGYRPGAQHYEHTPSIADLKYAVIPNDQHLPQAQHGVSPRTPPQRPVQFNETSYYQSPNSNSRPQSRTSPPPLPPKTPIDASTTSPQTYKHNYHERERSDESMGPTTFMNMGDLSRRLPYPDIEGPPPTVNTASKPQLPPR